MKKIVLVTARRCGTNQTKNVALNLSSIGYFKALRDNNMVDIANHRGTSYCGKVTTYEGVLMGTVVGEFTEFAVLNSEDDVKVKKIDSVSDTFYISTGADGFEFTFYYKNVESYLKILISYELAGLSTPDFDKIKELEEKRESLMEEMKAQ